MLPKAPNKPGVYLIKDRSGKIIYIGKAIDIAKRIKSHYRSDSKLSPHISDIDFIITSNELEALVLEAVLIKKHHPRYNVLLRDDKQYPYVKITVNEEWPSIQLVRKINCDGAKYFGPYRGQTVRDIFKVVKRLFQIRWCRNFKKRTQPCFYYTMGKCLAPCARDVSREDYMRSIRDIESFLKGRVGPAIGKLKQEMTAASANREYEVAARIRDKLRLFEKINEEQKIVTTDRRDKDVFHVETVGSRALVLVLEIRSGKLVGKQSYFIRDTKLDEEDLLSSTMVQYYTGAAYIPDEVIADAKENRSILEKALKKLKGSPVILTSPKKGNEMGLLRMAWENAKFMLQERLKSEDESFEALFELKRSLELESVPNRIEAFDVSTTMGIETVGSMVAFEGGVPLKSDYRKFKIAAGRKMLNDVAGIRNIVMRRYTASLSHKLPIPDLVLIDGGLTQLNAARPFIPKGTQVIGLAKKLEEIYMPGKKGTLRLKQGSRSLRLLQRIRDEAHRFAITFHKKRRAARMISQ